MTKEELTSLMAATEQAAKEIRAIRDAGIIQATQEGMRQVDIIRATGLSRETIRQIQMATATVQQMRTAMESMNSAFRDVSASLQTLLPHLAEIADALPEGEDG